MRGKNCRIENSELGTSDDLEVDVQEGSAGGQRGKRLAKERAQQGVRCRSVPRIQVGRQQAQNLTLTEPPPGRSSCEDGLFQGNLVEERQQSPDLDSTEIQTGC